MAEVSEQQVAEINNLQRQLQMTVLQKQQLQLSIEELKAADAELAKSKGAVYRAAGGLLVESSREDARKEIKERMETAELRVNVLGKQEEKLKQRFGEMREKIESALKKK